MSATPDDLKPVPEILGEFVLAAKQGKFAKLGEAPPPFPPGLWWCEPVEGLRVTFDGYSMDEDEKENMDWESYIVAIDLDDGYVSFFVGMEDCLTKPFVNHEYVNERYHDDVAGQLEGTSYSREKFEALVNNFYKKWKK